LTRDLSIAFSSSKIMILSMRLMFIVHCPKLSWIMPLILSTITVIKSKRSFILVYTFLLIISSSISCSFTCIHTIIMHSSWSRYYLSSLNLPHHLLVFLYSIILLEQEASKHSFSLHVFHKIVRLLFW
jgi:hypothetical protein